MAKTTVEATNPSWGVTRTFGKRFINTTRGSVEHVDGQRTEVKYEFDFDNLPPFFSNTSNANTRLAPGGVITECYVEVQEAWVGGTNLQLQAVDQAGNATNIGSAILTATMANKGNMVKVDVGVSGVTLDRTDDYHVFKVVATGTYTAGQARVMLVIQNPQNADSKIKYNHA